MQRGVVAQALMAAALMNVVVSTPLAAQVVASRLVPDAITLDLDSAVTKRLASVEDFVAEKQWDVVATLLRQTPVEKPDALVPLAPNWYVGVTQFCQCRAASLPPLGLAAYRRQMDATAKKWLDDAARTHDRDGFRRIARQAFATSFGDEAISRLAEQSFESGDFATARTCWELLLPATDSVRAAAGIGLLRHPDASADPAQIRAALVLCSLFEGHVSRARRELAAFQRLHAEATGRVAGREGVLADLLADQLRALPVMDRGMAPPRLDQPRWTRELPMPFARSETVLAIGDMFPVRQAGTVFASNGETVFAFDAETGRAKWSDGAADADDPRAAIIHTLADPVAPKWPIAERPLHTLAVVEGRLYARLGTPVTGRAKQESHAHSELVGLDIGTGEGKLAWRVAADEVDSRDALTATAPWCFEGSPVADARRVFVALRRSLPQQQINVACFDADSARLLWNRRIGITVAATEETVNSTSHLRLTLAEDSVFVSTDNGAIAALDVEDGTVRWLRTYPSEAALVRVGHTPPLHHAGVLYVAPLDSRSLLAIHAESGALLWQREWPDSIQYLLGVAGETLIVSGRSLWGVRLDTGEPAWPHRRIGYADPEGFSWGRGTIVGDEILWPNREELFIVSARTGQITRRVPLRGGHLTAAGSLLLISDENRLRVLGP